MVQSLQTPQDIAAIFALVTKPVVQGQKAEDENEDVHQAASIAICSGMTR
jgi:hypothetical protein